MAKQSGLGAGYYLDQFDVSNDTNSFGSISKSQKPIEMTGIDKLAFERIAGQLDGDMKWVSYLNPTNAHTALSSLPRTDRIASYFHRQTVGAPVASMVTKQTGYDPKRDADGKILIDVDAVANSSWLDWGWALTAGKKTDTVASNGVGVDLSTFGTPANFGLQGYLHVFSFTGTSVTIAIQDSADNISFANVTGGVFTVVSGATKERIATGRTQAVRRYLRVATTGTFSNVVFAVQATVNIADLTI